MALAVYSCLEKCTLEKPANAIEAFFNENPTIFKIVLIIDHLIRAACMVAVMYLPIPIPMAASVAICFAASLFYRLTVEKNCPFKFAIPAFAGAVAFLILCPAVINMINGTAFKTATSSFLTVASFLPMLGYLGYITITTHYDVNKRCCCKSLKDIS